MSSIILVIDFQQCFNTEEIEDDVRRLTKSTDYPIISLEFKNREGSIFEEELNYKDSIKPKEPEWLIRRSDRIFDRFGYDATRSEEFSRYLSNKRVERCYIVGVETDACVLSTAMGLFDMGIQPIVIKNCCTTEASNYIEKSALDILERNIGHQNVIRLDAMESDLEVAFND